MELSECTWPTGALRLASTKSREFTIRDQSTNTDNTAAIVDALENKDSVRNSLDDNSPIHTCATDVCCDYFWSCVTCKIFKRIFCRSHDAAGSMQNIGEIEEEGGQECSKTEEANMSSQTDVVHYEDAVEPETVISPKALGINIGIDIKVRNDYGKIDFLTTISQLPDEPDVEELLMVFSKSATKALSGVAFRIYMLPTGKYKNKDDNRILRRTEDNKLEFTRAIPHGHVLEAGRKSSCMLSPRWLSPLQQNMNNEEMFFVDLLNEIDPQEELKIAMLIPLLILSGETQYIVEIWRPTSFPGGTETMRIATAYSAWGSSTLFYCSNMIGRIKQNELTLNLLATLKDVFQEMLSLEVVIQRILKFVQQLVNADRASLFMVDQTKNELVSTVFDQKLDDDSKEKKEIRIPMDRGIAGHVATTGAYVNIPDAYKDPRFNSKIDETTGYKTTSILCMPINVEGQIIGVVQMVNKRDVKQFLREDVHSFVIFESFFGLALHHAKMYEKIIRNEQKYRVAIEVLSYHNTCKEDEVQELVSLEPPDATLKLQDHLFDPYSLDVKEKCQSVLVMFQDLFGMEQFDSLDLARFLLTVKKNYRDVPYHNFNHGWAVAQTMYTIIKDDREERFTYKQRLALFVASLCHDLDHRGYTNKYMNETESPLAAMYTTSTLEHHHFNITVTILQQDGHNIFSRFDSEDYKEILNLIRISILATDLDVFFVNLQKMKQISAAEPNNFSWEDKKNTELAMAISMTAADLSASAKPWNVQLKTVHVICEEFYTQGDKERAAGRTPIPMMDRTKPEQQPRSQVDFLQKIALPCYQALQVMIPTTADLHTMTTENLMRWKKKVDDLDQAAEEFWEGNTSTFNMTDNFSDLSISYVDLEEDSFVNVLNIPEDLVSLPNNPEALENLPDIPEDLENLPNIPEELVNRRNIPKVIVNLPKISKEDLNLPGNPESPSGVFGDLNLSKIPKLVVVLPDSPESTSEIFGNLNLLNVPKLYVNLPDRPKGVVNLSSTAEEVVNLQNIPEDATGEQEVDTLVPLISTSNTALRKSEAALRIELGELYLESAMKRSDSETLL